MRTLTPGDAASASPPLSRARLGVYIVRAHIGIGRCSLETAPRWCPRMHRSGSGGRDGCQVVVKPRALRPQTSNFLSAPI